MQSNCVIKVGFHRQATETTPCILCIAGMACCACHQSPPCEVAAEPSPSADLRPYEEPLALEPVVASARSIRRDCPYPSNISPASSRSAKSSTSPDREFHHRPLPPPACHCFRVGAGRGLAARANPHGLRHPPLAVHRSFSVLTGAGGGDVSPYAYGYGRWGGYGTYGGYGGYGRAGGLGWGAELKCRDLFFDLQW